MIAAGETSVCPKHVGASVASLNIFPFGQTPLIAQSQMLVAKLTPPTRGDD